MSVQDMSVITLNKTFSKKFLFTVLSGYLAYKGGKNILFNKNYHQLFKKIGKRILSLFDKPVSEEIANPTDPVVGWLFFDSSNLECRRHVISRIPCDTEDCSYYKLQFILDFILSATETIDLCMYLITCTDIAEALIEAHNKGILVRVIVEEEMSTSSESKAQNLIHAGIVVKSKVIPSFMHHKFCIVDADIPFKRKLMTGSLNWTLQGLAGNWENVIITKVPDIVKSYHGEFNEIWKYFDVKTKKPYTPKPRNEYFSSSEEYVDDEDEEDDDDEDDEDDILSRAR